MKHPTTSRFVLVAALFAALFGVGLMTSEAHAQRRPSYGQGGFNRGGGGGYDRGNLRREIIRREVFRRAAMNRAPARWGRHDRFDRAPAPRWQPAPRGRRGRW